MSMYYGHPPGFGKTFARAMQFRVLCTAHSVRRVVIDRANEKITIEALPGHRLAGMNQKYFRGGVLYYTFWKEHEP